MAGCYDVIMGTARKSILLKGRTPEQQSVIKYFISDGGCLSSIITMNDTDFDRILQGKVSSLKIEEMAIAKLGVDPSQIKDVKPIFLDGYYFDEEDKDIFIKTWCKDNVDRCSKYQLSGIFFSQEQLFMYSYLFDLTNLKVSEKTAEYFYHDITSVSVDTVVIEKMRLNKGCLGFLDFSYYTSQFLKMEITTAGKLFSCSVRVENEPAINGMRHLIRERKR